MLDDYKMSREQMNNLSQKLSLIASDMAVRRDEVVPLVAFAPTCGTSEARKKAFANLAESLSRDRVNLHAKINLICNALNV